MQVSYSIAAIFIFILGARTDPSPAVIQDITPSQVEELYQKFIAVLNLTFKETNSSVGNNQYDVDDEVGQALYRAQYYLYLELTVYNRNDFQDIIDKATAQGTNYDRCQTYYSKFLTLDTVFYPDLIICINSTGNAARSIFQKNIADLKHLYTNIPNVTAEIENCGGTNQTCLSQISTEISQMNSTISLKMVDISSKSNSTAVEYLIKVQNCTDNSRKELRVMARTLMAEYEECTGLDDNFS